MKELPSLTIKGKVIKSPITQGGMGVAVSLYPLASAVAREDGTGIISSTCLDRILAKRNNKPYTFYDAVYEEVSLAKEKANGGFIGINIMALLSSFDVSVKAAIDAGADMIISGAGLPLNLPAIQPPRETALIPIVSSARALEIICKKWEKLGYRPDAAVLEGPLAGGHLGFKMEEIGDPVYTLENLLPRILETADKFGSFPIIVAGGIYTHADIVRFINMGASGVQMATRFMVTEESSASDRYKQAVIAATRNDIEVTDRSPCGFLFRVLATSPMYQSVIVGERPIKCNKGYLLRKDSEGNYGCPAREENPHCFCMCNGLLSSSGYNPDEEESIYTVGTNAYRIDRIVPVKTLMRELTSGRTD